MELAKLDSTKITGGGMVFSIIHRPRVDSTNAVAYRLATEGAAEGTIVIADAQENGRGRLGRKWFSPAGHNIYASIILRPTIEPRFASQIPLLVGLAVKQALKNYLPHVFLKWPNDVLVGDKKICGILTEMKGSAEGVEFLVVGIGININQRDHDFDEAIAAMATSLLMETGREYPREEALKKVLFRLGDLYYRYLQDGFGAIKDEWLKSAQIIGKKVAVAFKENSIVGVVVAVNDYGSLICRQEDGALVEISAGDATILKE